MDRHCDKQKIMKQLSLVICVYNEEQNIKPLSEQIKVALSNYDYEAIFVDDDSSDKTREEIQAINDEHFILVELKRHYGQGSALQAGIDQTTGEYVVLLDGDLQNDPADIPTMMKICKEGGWDMVAGVRANRKDNTLLRKIPSKIANYIIRKSTGTKMKDIGCTLKVFTNKAIKSIRIYGGLHRFIPVLLTYEGLTRLTQVEVNHRVRKFGKSKYNLSRTPRVISDLLLILFFKKYMQRTMHFFGGLGIITLGTGLLFSVYLLILKMMGQDISDKPLLIPGLLLILTGIQFIIIGIIAEIQMLTYFETHKKTLYRIRKISVTKEKTMG